MTTDSAEEQDWPTHCEHCGTELESGVVEVMPGGDEELATVVAQDFCPNGECPAKAPSLAPEAHPDPGARMTQVAENRPGSLGGDNGGA